MSTLTQAGVTYS